MAEVRRHDSCDRIDITVQTNFFTNNIGIGAEAAVPIGVADYHWLRETGQRISGNVRAAELRMNAEHGEVVGVRAEQFDSFRMFAAGDVAVGCVNYRNVLKYA